MRGHHGAILGPVYKLVAVNGRGGRYCTAGAVVIDAITGDSAVFCRSGGNTYGVGDGVEVGHYGVVVVHDQGGGVVATRLLAVHCPVGKGIAIVGRGRNLHFIVGSILVIGITCSAAATSKTNDHVGDEGANKTAATTGSACNCRVEVAAAPSSNATVV